MSYISAHVSLKGFCFFWVKISVDSSVVYIKNVADGAAIGWIPHEGANYIRAISGFRFYRKSGLWQINYFTSESHKREGNRVNIRFAEGFFLMKSQDKSRRGMA